MGLILLLTLQVVVTVGGLFMVWRRLDRISGDIAELRQDVETGRAQPRRRRAGGASVAPIDAAAPENATLSPAWSRATRSWRMREAASTDGGAVDAPTVSPEMLRGFVLFVLAAAPAAGFLFGANHSAIVASGVTIAAAMMLIALRPIWRAAAWAGVLTGAAWLGIGLALNAEHISFCVAITLAASAAIAHMHLRHAAPGATLTLLCAAAALALGAQSGMVGAGGIAFGAIAATAAAVGAMSLRLEGLHLAAFGASLLGLFVLSGQDSAAIWFTPAVTWAGAWFFALAVIRVPQLGRQGAAIAGAGAVAPLIACGALHLSEHGLANDYAAAAAFFVASAALGGLIVLAAMRDARGLAPLRMTLWILALAAFVAMSSAFFIAAPAAPRAAMFALLGLALAALDGRFPHAVWRAFAVTAAGLAAFCAWMCVRQIGAETPGWSPWVLIALGLALPAAIGLAAAFVAQRNQATFTAGAFETLSIATGVAAANLIVRTLMSGGALQLHPVGFVEEGVHASIWLAAALYLGWRQGFGATMVRRAAVAVLGIGALVSALACGVLWFTPIWSERGESVFLTRDSLGFALPALLCWLHWVMWRGRSEARETRVALGAAAALTAAAITLEVIELRADVWARGGDWVSMAAGIVVFALALGMNFAPGVVNANTPQQLDLEKYLKANRRGEQRRQVSQ